MKKSFVWMPLVVQLCAFGFAGDSPIKARSKWVMPAILFKPTPHEMVEMYHLAQRDPAALLSYLDEEWLDRKLYGGTPPDFSDGWLRYHLRLYAVRLLGDNAPPELIAPLEEYAQRFEARAKAARGMREDLKQFADEVRCALERIRYRLQGQDAYVKAMMEWVRTPEPVELRPGDNVYPIWQKVEEGARALGVLQAREAVPVLMERVSSDRTKMCGRALARIGDKRAMEVLREYVGSCFPEIVHGGLYTPPLEPGEPDPAWVYWQMRTEGMSLEQAILEIAYESSKANLRKRDILEYIGQPAVPVLVKVLEDLHSPDHAVSVALDVLITMRAPEAARAFLNILRRGPYKADAARGLGWLGAREAFDDLLAAAKQDRDMKLRVAAIEALGRLEDKRAEPLLLDLVAHPDPNIRVIAAKALHRAGTPAAIPKLEQILQNEPYPVIRGAMRSAINVLRQKAR